MMMNKTGRKPHEIHSYNNDKLIKLYKMYGSMRAIARALEVNRESVRRLYEERGILEQCVKLYEESGTVQVVRKSYGMFAKWLEQNPKVKLPRSHAKIAEVVGCAATAIRDYYYRERKIVKERLKLMPNLVLLEIDLRSSYGYAMNTKDILRYRYSVDRFTLAVSVHAYPRPGAVGVYDDGREVLVKDLIVVFPLPSLRVFEQRMKALLVELPLSVQKQLLSDRLANQIPQKQ